MLRTFKSNILILLVSFFLPPAMADKSQMSCTAALTDGFSVNIADISLNPEKFLVRHDGKTIQLSILQYSIFEELVLSDKFLEFQDLVEIRDSVLIKSPHKEEASDFAIASVKAIRKKLKENFGSDFAARIKNFYGLGYSWITPVNPADIVLNKIWKPSDRPYYMYGDSILDISRQAIGILDAFKTHDCRALGTEIIISYFESSAIPTPQHREGITYIVKRTNEEFKKISQSTTKIVSSLGYGTRMYAINKDLFTLCK